ncbi:DUF3703 domain-containing protein [Adhaeribacter sp. BT258]|uniref:DUF3703 domain-containing protein n=1 Tax=Adhaeribacter terrigena TaxID=2793070 RepID=A0ABS1BXQ3_9BACT|nr:DUF3703 domain-containing protein [Adhaeribacter terrigena]MBK0401874.1 DUF3703 domain-containing protein [Adhaeribacter terrigena]
MKFNLKMPDKLTPFYKNELDNYVANFRNGELQIAWFHLERAHILGQAFPVPHTSVHWQMLKFGWQIKSVKEVAGQLPRLLVGGIKSFVGKIPVGNTGGANVPPLLPMEIPADLKQILSDYK